MPGKRKPTLEKSSPEEYLDQSFARPAEAADPIAMARRDLNKTLPGRFYDEVTVQQLDGTFVLLLDGRAAKSAGRNHLALPAWRRHGRSRTNGRRGAKRSIRRPCH